MIDGRGAALQSSRTVRSSRRRRAGSESASIATTFPHLTVKPMMAKLLVARRGAPVRIEGVSDSADPARDLFENGGLLPGPEATLAGPTFEEWLNATS
jgi:hypothetical protein